MQLGDFTIDWVSDGVFRLDGGAMFGAVPKVLWEKKVEADSRNRIPLGLNCILVTTPFGRLLLDTGLGNKLSAKQHDIFGITQPPTVESSLAALGLSCDDIDHVILSHCDFDHLGGATKRVDGDRVVPAFPKATYHIRKEEWEDLTHPNARAKGTYLKENWEALASAGVVRLIEKDGELFPGISTYHTGGHTRGHIVIELVSRGQTAVYMGDLMPSHHHLNPLWVMAFDNYPMVSIEARGAWLNRIAERDGWVLFYHDVELAAGRWALDGTPKELLPLSAAGASVPRL